MVGNRVRRKGIVLLFPKQKMQFSWEVILFGTAGAENIKRDMAQTL